MIKSVWVKMFIYLGTTFVAPYLAFMAGVYDAWTTDRTVKLDVPPWVWGYITLQAGSQTLIVLRAYIDSSYAKNAEEVKQQTQESK
jgi:hypothetical protein